MGKRCVYRDEKIQWLFFQSTTKAKPNTISSKPSYREKKQKTYSSVQRSVTQPQLAPSTLPKDKVMRIFINVPNLDRSTLHVYPSLVPLPGMQ